MAKTYPMHRTKKAPLRPFNDNLVRASTGCFQLMHCWTNWSILGGRNCFPQYVDKPLASIVIILTAKKEKHFIADDKIDLGHNCFILD